MKKGRARRRNHYKRTGWMGGRVWLLSALAAAALIYGVAQLKTGGNPKLADARVSTENAGTGPQANQGNIPTDTVQEKQSAPDKEQAEPTAWNIRVVDADDSLEVEIPSRWQESPDSDATREALEKEAAIIAGKWDRKPVDSQMESFDKAAGEYRYSKEADGRILDQAQLVKSLTEAVKENSRQGQITAGQVKTNQVKANQGQVTASFQTVSPKRTQAQAKKQYRIIGTFSTNTTKNQNRNQNISLAAEAIDGMVLKPGEEFSFNDATGNRTRDKGYQPAGAYRNGVLIEEPGGGVCQVSTTLYHAIVDSGLKATERNFHSFAPSYVAKGQDAMVSFDGYAGPDLKFVNSATTSVGLRASFRDDKLKLSLVGLPVLEDGTTVSLRSEKVRDLAPPEPVYEENPELAYGEEKVIDEAQPGSVWKTYREVKKDGKVLEETALNTSTYKAKPARIQRNLKALPVETQEQEAGEPGTQEQGTGGQNGDGQNSSLPENQGTNPNGEGENQKGPAQRDPASQAPAQPDPAGQDLASQNPATQVITGSPDHISGAAIPELSATGHLLLQ